LLIQTHGHCRDERKGRRDSSEEIVEKQGTQIEVKDLARQKIMEKKTAFYQLSGSVLIARNIKFDSKSMI
jgi:hypothetical protein